LATLKKQKNLLTSVVRLVGKTLPKVKKKHSISTQTLIHMYDYLYVQIQIQVTSLMTCTVGLTEHCEY